MPLPRAKQGGRGHRANGNQNPHSQLAWQSPPARSTRMPKLLAAVLSGAIVLVPLFGAIFGPIATDVAGRDMSYDNSTINRASKADRLAIGSAMAVVKTTAILNPAFQPTRSTPDTSGMLTDCEPVISPLADALSGSGIRECST